jgi:DNA replication and repair protein RecF
LEAIMVLAIGSSYRVKDAELLQYGADWARLDATTPDGMRSLKLVPQPTGLMQKEFIIQDVHHKRLSLQKSLPIVLFEPNHLLLLAGSPDARREYLDELLEQTVVGYATTRRQYRRALAQRNSLLKHGHNVAEQLFVWNIRLSQLGGQIAAERMRMVQDISSRIEQTYQRLSHTSAKVTAQYMSACQADQYSSDMLYKLEQSVQKDLERGFTTFGPHRDDLGFTLGGRTIQEAASRGETRTLLLSLKVLELELLERHRGKKPLLLLDDVFSELDGARRRALTETLQDHQTFITTTDADVVLKHFTDNARILPLS